MTTINQDKTLLTNITRSIQSELSTEEIIALTAIFNKLHNMYPKEIHFTIGRATDNNGLGTNVWGLKPVTEAAKVS